MWRYSALILFLLLPGIAMAYITDVAFSSSLVEGEDLEVGVVGYMPSLCWEFLGSTTNAYNQMLVVYIDTINPTPDADCPAMIISFEVDEVFEGLEPGLYTLRIYENRPPWEPNILDFPVDVSSAVGNGSETWAAVKALYR